MKRIDPGVMRRALVSTLSGARGQRGVSVVEVLVAVAVLSIGLLGLARLQGVGLRAAHGSYTRTQATTLASDMADMMRANRVAALAGEYDIGIEDPSPPAVSRATEDLAAWRAAIAATVPGGVSAIERAGRVFTVTIRWGDGDGGNGAQNLTLRTEI